MLSEDAYGLAYVAATCHTQNKNISKKSAIGSNKNKGKQSGVEHTLHRQGWVSTQSVP